MRTVNDITSKDGTTICSKQDFLAYRTQFINISDEKNDVECIKLECKIKFEKNTKTHSNVNCGISHSEKKFKYLKSKKSKKDKNKKNKNDKKQKNTNKSKFFNAFNNSDDVIVNQIYAFHISADIASAKQKFQIDFEISEFIILYKEHFIEYIKLNIFKSVIATNDDAMQTIDIDMI